MFSHFPYKIEKREVFHPVIIIYHDCRIRLARIEINKLGQLDFNSRHVLLNGILVQQIPF